MSFYRLKHMTRRELLNYAEENKLPVYQIGYCCAAHLLRRKNPFAYNSGVYGWDWYAYRLERCIVCTGYRNLVGKVVDYDASVYPFELQAEELKSWGYQYDEDMDEILLDFEAALLDH